MLQEVFEKLQALQDVLEQIYKIERELEEIPKDIITSKELLTRLKKQFIEKSGNLEKRQLKVKELRSQLKDAEEKRGNYEKQMDVIKTQKEYELLDKAIKESILEEQQLRKDLVKEEKETEELNQDVEKMQALVSAQEESIRGQEEEIQSKSDAMKQELDALNAQKKKITPGIDEEILFKFERIIKSRGKGIVPVDILKEKDNEIKAFICSECHMVLPIQFVNDVHSQDSLMFCPYCSRILYYDESIDDQNMIYNSDADLIGGFAGLDEEEEEEEEDFDEADDERASDADESTGFEDDDAVYDDEADEEEDDLLNEEGEEFGESPDEEGMMDDEEEDDLDDESDEDEDDEDDEDEDPDADFDDGRPDDG